MGLYVHVTSCFVVMGVCPFVAGCNVLIRNKDATTVMDRVICQDLMNCDVAFYCDISLG